MRIFKEISELLIEKFQIFLLAIVRIKRKPIKNAKWKSREKRHWIELELIMTIVATTKQRISDIQVRGNVSLKYENKHYDKKISGVIKKIDSVKWITEYFQDKHGEKWNLIDS